MGVGAVQRKGMEYEFAWRVLLNQACQAVVENAPVTEFIGQMLRRSLGYTFFKPITDWRERGKWNRHAKRNERLCTEGHEVKVADETYCRR